ncbi:LysR family transcriptional regulator [Allosphingosinicella deserti]|uniref:LysR family transcriptional regulator n=1 Tax=Allosphingosinicella deserti TaxID=2116704 RepID=A0A2P7QLP9_9SPHN|nr:LysR family transcriptional regulator [Sphingomonas deserti]PSJ38869.1 LysR family transcriptional regulator [Sphingomonas deserti]
MSLGPSSLESLRVFDACARHGSYTRAAEELGISPAAVSQRMRHLQADIGAPLFDRRGPRIALTDSGKELAGKVGQALTILGTAVQSCRDCDTIRVSAAPTFASRWLAPRLASFAGSRTHRITIDAASDLRAPGSFDVAIRSGLGRWKGFQATLLFPIEATPLYNPQLYRPAPLAAPRDLVDCARLPSDAWPAWFEAAGVDVPGDAIGGSGVRYPTQDLAGAAVLEGAGIALLSPRLFADALGAGRLVRPFETMLHGPAGYWVLISDHDRRPSVLAFRAWLVEASRKTGL